MYCHTCDADKHPVQALKPDRGIVQQCPTCESVFPETAHETVATPQPERAPLFADNRTTTPQAEASDDDILARMRARLAVVEAEIAKRNRFEVERDRLRRMLAAANEDPQTIALTN